MLIVGIVLGLIIGFSCRWFDVPLPSPPNIVGSFLVVAMTVGFMTADQMLTHKAVDKNTGVAALLQEK